MVVLRSVVSSLEVKSVDGASRNSLVSRFAKSKLVYSFDAIISNPTLFVALGCFGNGLNRLEMTRAKVGVSPKHVQGCGREAAET